MLPAWASCSAPQSMTRAGTASGSSLAMTMTSSACACTPAGSEFGGARAGGGGVLAACFGASQASAKPLACTWPAGVERKLPCPGSHPHCIACRRYVATGQQKDTGPTSVPYVCIWDVDNCNLMQRLDHDISERA